MPDFHKSMGVEVLLGALATRSFITGAGYISKNNYHYAQKASRSHIREEGYGYNSYMFRLPTNSQQRIDRVEIRCGDINLSDWAVRMRVGIAALALSVQQTEHVSTIPQYSSSSIQELNICNILNLQDDGTIRNKPEIAYALSYQRWLAETSLTLADQPGDGMPEELKTVANELVRYCDDFDAILKGEATIHTLAGRADWADKFTTILRSRQRDVTRGIERQHGDVKERAQDILYDQIEINVGQNDRKISYGWGYKLQRNQHGHRPQAVQLEDAVVNPPDTRARVRSACIREGYQISEWDKVMVDGSEYYLPDPSSDKVA